MAYESLKLAKSPITDEIYLGRVKTLKNGMSVWAEGKRNMTNDFLQCVLERWTGYEETISASNGKKYVISVKEI